MIFDFPAEVTRSHRERAASALQAGGATVAMWIAGKETRLDKHADPLDPDLPRLAQAFAEHEREISFVETKHVETGVGDYSEECTGCGQTVPGPHRYTECLANIAVGESALNRYAGQIDEKNLALEAELAECKEGYHALDRNWEAVHNSAMEAFRGALEMPDASVPEMVIRIREWRNDLREHSSFTSPGTFVKMGPEAPHWHLHVSGTDPLFVFTDGEGTFVIAKNSDDVVPALNETYGEWQEVDWERWDLVLPTMKIRIEGREQTAAEWLAQINKRGLLCTE